MSVQNESLQREIIDLQSEFQFERIDYLDTIRKQERDIALLQALLDKVHPCLRRDCNYANMDKVRRECKWDEEEGKWILPRMSINNTALPVAGLWLFITTLFKLLSSDWSLFFPFPHDIFNFDAP